MRVVSDRHPCHRKGSGARVLLSSVFGPYARDDEYGSRSVNPMELYQNHGAAAVYAMSLGRTPPRP